MFPASAGMNRRRGDVGRDDAHVPRERGDEPSAIKDVRSAVTCSPRARG